MLVNNAGIYEGVADNATDEEWHAAWQRTLTINLQAPADLAELAVVAFPRPRRCGPHRQRRQPRRLPRRFSPQHWHYAASKAAIVGMTRTIARGYAADGILAFAVAPGFTVSEMTEEYLAGRGGAAIVADIPLGRVATTDEVAEAIRWLAIDAPASATGTRDRRQRRQLCSLACRRRRTRRSAFPLTIPLQKPPRQVERPVAPIETAGPSVRRACKECDDWDKPAPPVRIHGNTYLVGTCGISAILITGTEGHILIDAGTEKGADLIARNIRSLGFRLSDVSYLLHSHEHLDHVGGMARLQQLTGAQLIASASRRRGASADRRGRRGRPAGRDAPAVPGRPRRPDHQATARTVRLGNLMLTADRDAGPYARRAELALGQLRRRGVPTGWSMPTA